MCTLLNAGLRSADLHNTADDSVFVLDVYKNCTAQFSF